MKDPQLLRQRIAAGLSAHLDEVDLQQAMRRWDSQYAGTPSTSLQKFVFDIASDGSLRARRSHILVSLVKAVNAAEVQPVKQPRKAREKPQTTADPAVVTAAFSVLMVALTERLDAIAEHYLRLDLAESLSQRRLPKQLVEPMRSWLTGNGRLDIQEACPAVVLQGLLNRTYVLLCERVGPVKADKVLAQAVDTVQKQHPQLKEALVALL